MLKNISEPKGILQTCLSTAWGGLEMVAFEVAQKMTALGHPVTTVCPPGSPLETRLRQAGLDVFTIERKNKYFCWSGVRRLRQALKTGRYSVVLIEQMNELWQVVPALWRMPNVRLVGISHTFLALAKKDFGHRYLYGRMNCLIALTEIHKKNLIDKLPVHADHVEVLPNAVDPAKFNPARRSDEFRARFLRSPEEILIGVVARLDRGKGVFEVVDVAEKLRDDGVQFRLIVVGNETAGEPGTKLALEEQIAQRRLKDHLLLIGHRSDVETVMASLDVLLMPSPFETFGRVLIEAMASGVAVVAAGGGGVPDIVHNERNGLLVKPLQAHEMAAAIEKYYHNPELRRRLAERGREEALDKYDYKKVDQRLYEMLGLNAKVH